MFWIELPQSDTKVIKNSGNLLFSNDFLFVEVADGTRFRLLPFRFISRLSPFRTCQTSCRQFPCWIVRLFPALPAVLWDAKPILAPRKHSDIDNRVASKLIRNVMPLTVIRHSNDIIRTQTNANRTSRIIRLKSSQTGRKRIGIEESRRKGEDVLNRLKTFLLLVLNQRYGDILNQNCK